MFSVRRSRPYGDAPALLCADPVRKAESPLRKLHREPFDQHVRRALQRSASNPLLRCVTPCLSATTEESIEF